MTKEELYALVGHEDLFRDVDIKTLVLDLIREKYDNETLLALLWPYLDDLDETRLRGYFYRRFS